MCWILGIRIGGLRECWERGVWMEVYEDRTVLATEGG